MLLPTNLPKTDRCSLLNCEEDTGMDCSIFWEGLCLNSLALSIGLATRINRMVSMFHLRPPQVNKLTFNRRSSAHPRLMTRDSLAAKEQGASMFDVRCSMFDVADVAVSCTADELMPMKDRVHTSLVVYSLLKPAKVISVRIV
jgi:hypothetical protein